MSARESAYKHGQDRARQGSGPPKQGNNPQSVHQSAVAGWRDGKKK